MKAAESMLRQATWRPVARKRTAEVLGELKQKKRAFQALHDSTATIRQTAIFDPVGLWGRLYWYALYHVIS